MSSKQNKGSITVSIKEAVEQEGPLVSRSSVPSGKTYSEYRQYLRNDFFCSCAYCTMSEAEAQAIRFTIDHYEPRSVRPDLQDAYDNLMYACDECNRRKGDLSPPPAARTAGFRFFRPDEDIRSQHFEVQDIRINPKTNVGTFSIDALDLNRLMLRKLRDIRRRLTQCDQHVAEGVLALKKFHIDQLPQNIKGRADRAIKDATAMATGLGHNIDSLLREFAQSPLLEPEEDNEERTKQRSAKLKTVQSLYPGNWRAPRNKKK